MGVCNLRFRAWGFRTYGTYRASGRIVRCIGLSGRWKVCRAFGGLLLGGSWVVISGDPCSVKASVVIPFLNVAMSLQVGFCRLALNRTRGLVELKTLMKPRTLNSEV